MHRTAQDQGNLLAGLVRCLIPVGETHMSIKWLSCLGCEAMVRCRAQQSSIALLRAAAELHTSWLRKFIVCKCVQQAARKTPAAGHVISAWPEHNANADWTYSL